MASIEEEGTRGKHLSYKIRVCLGRDENGRHISKAMRWNPPENMTPAKARKEVAGGGGLGGSASCPFFFSIWIRFSASIGNGTTLQSKWWKKQFAIHP